MRFAWPIMKMPKAGALSFLAAGSVFAALNLWQQHQRLQVVPTVNRYIAAGSRVTLQDIRWVPIGQLRNQTIAWGHYARTILIPGDLVTSAMLTGQKSHTVTVAVSPTSAADMVVAQPGANINVVVIGSHGLLWQSGSVPVLDSPSGSGLFGSTGGVEVAMSMHKALAFDQVKSHGQVSLVGVSP